MTQLVRQTYGVAMAQVNFGGPTGVWLECTACNNSDRITNVSVAIPDADAASIFRSGGWTGEGDRMLRAKCPSCSAVPVKDQTGGAA